MHRERIGRFCKKLLSTPEGKRVPVVSVFNVLKNEELLITPGQQSVVLANEISRLGHSIHKGNNFSELSCLSCARQVVRLAQSYSALIIHCNDPLEQHSSESYKATSSKRSTAIRSPTGDKRSESKMTKTRYARITRYL